MKFARVVGSVSGKKHEIFIHEREFVALKYDGATIDIWTDRVRHHDLSITSTAFSDFLGELKRHSSLIVEVRSLDDIWAFDRRKIDSIRLYEGREEAEGYDLVSIVLGGAGGWMEQYQLPFNEEAEARNLIQTLTGYEF